MIQWGCVAGEVLVASAAGDNGIEALNNAEETENQNNQDQTQIQPQVQPQDEEQDEVTNDGEQQENLDTDNDASDDTVNHDNDHQNNGNAFGHTLGQGHQHEDDEHSLDDYRGSSPNAEGPNEHSNAQGHDHTH